MVITRVGLIIVGLAALRVDALTGDETICIGSSGHTVNYDFDADTMENIRDVAISVRADSSISCRPQSGRLSLPWTVDPKAHKQFCIGANVDDSCTMAGQSLPLNAYLDCSNCFVGVTTDLFYSLNISNRQLNEVHVGFQNTHLRAAMEVSSELFSTAVPTWSTQIGGGKTPIISFKVAGIFPVTISLATDTQIFTSPGETYGTHLTNLGAHLDLDFGDHSVSWVRGNGFGFSNTSADARITPVIHGPHAEASLNLGSRSHVGVDISGVLSYDFNINAPMFLKAGNEKVGNQTRWCLSGGANVEVSHEAHLGFDLLGGAAVEFARWGPQNLYSYHDITGFQKCLGLKSTDVIEESTGTNDLDLVEVSLVGNRSNIVETTIIV